MNNFDAVRVRRCTPQLRQALEFENEPDIPSCNCNLAKVGYLTRSKAIIIPIGSTEQHGPNGFVELMRVSWRWRQLSVPTKDFSGAHHFGRNGANIWALPAPSRLLSTLMAVIQHRQLFGRAYFDVLLLERARRQQAGNGSLLRSTLQAGRAGHNRPALRCKLRNWWDCEGVQAISAEEFGDSEGSHATCSEVSLTYYAYPDHVKDVAMTPEIAPKGPIYDAADYRRRFPDGRIGSNPALASVAVGERLFKAAVKELTVDFRAFEAGNP